MMTSPPCFQFTGVDTLCAAVSCSESITRSTSSKFRPVVIGDTMTSLTLLAGPATKTLLPRADVPAVVHRVHDDELALLVRSDHEDVADGLVVRGGPSFR